MKTLSKLATIAAAVVLVLAPLGAMVLGTMATEVQVIIPHDGQVTETNRLLWSAGEPVADIYGVPTNEKMEVLFVDEASLVLPEEDPSLVLLPVDKQAGENPLQLKTVWFLTRWSMAVAGLVVVLGGGLWFLSSRRRRTSAAPAEAS